MTFLRLKRPRKKVVFTNLGRARVGLSERQVADGQHPRTGGVDGVAPVGPCFNDPDSSFDYAVVCGRNSARAGTDARPEGTLVLDLKEERERQSYLRDAGFGAFELLLGLMGAGETLTEMPLRVFQLAHEYALAIGYDRDWERIQAARVSEGVTRCLRSRS